MPLMIAVWRIYRKSVRIYCDKMADTQGAGCVAFRTDESRVRKDHSPHNLAPLRPIPLTLLKQDPSIKVSIDAPRNMTGWDNDDPIKGRLKNLRLP